MLPNLVHAIAFRGKKMFTDLASIQCPVLNDQVFKRLVIWFYLFSTEQDFLE